MHIGRLFIVVAGTLFSVNAASIDHDKVQPFPQPVPVTNTEKSGVKFKPKFNLDEEGCVSYPAVNAAGETTGGLKGNTGNSACTSPPLGSQVYGRAEWYKDVWAIMYAWYFPKGFWNGYPRYRHDWSNAVVWIDNPVLENAKVLGMSLSTSENEYETKYVPIPAEALENGTTPSLYRLLSSKGAELGLYTNFAAGEAHDLIMWGQLTDAARVALNDQNNFGRTEVPINDEHFSKHLETAWPF